MVFSLKIEKGGGTVQSDIPDGSSIIRRRRSQYVQVESIVQTVLQQQRAPSAVMETVWERHVEEEAGGMWGGRLFGAKNYKSGTSNWIKDYVGTNGEPPNYPSSKFRRRFAIPRTLYDRLKDDLVRYRPEYWSARIIGGNRPGNLRM